MKTIIDGKTYDTDTATVICNLPCSYYPGDFNYHDTKLYRTKKGTFFISGEGGPLSMWSKPSGNNGMSGGSGLRVVPADQARNIMESANCDEDDFKAAGLDIEEG